MFDTSSSWILSRRQVLGGLACSAATLTASNAVAATTYPNRPIKLVVGFSAGGPTDVMARIFAAKLSTALGESVFIENKPGANAVLAADAVASAPADGHTLLFNTSSFALSAALSQKLSYDPLRDFRGISLTSSAPSVLLVHPSFKAKTPQEFVEELKKNPGKYNFGSAGTGTILHVIPVQLLQAGKLVATHIPYKGSAPMIVDLMGGQVQFAADNVATALPYIRNGSLRPIAVTAKQRLKVLPDVPTISESWIPNYEAIAWYGVMARASVPQFVVNKINEVLADILRRDDVKKSLANLGLDPLVSSPEEYDNYIRSEISRWTKVAKSADIKME